MGGECNDRHNSGVVGGPDFLNQHP
jgi:hypothetical protein